MQQNMIDGILYILRTGYQRKMLPKEYELGSTCHRRFQKWNSLHIQKSMDKTIKSMMVLSVLTGPGNPSIVYL